MGLQTIPTVEQMTSALIDHSNTSHWCGALHQAESPHRDTLIKASKLATVLGHQVKAFLEARDALNNTLQAMWDKSNLELTTLSDFFLSHLFKQSVPGLVALQDSASTRTIIEQVKRLKDLTQIGNELHGVVYTESGTRSFVVKNGQVFFNEDTTQTTW